VDDPSAIDAAETSDAAPRIAMALAPAPAVMPGSSGIAVARPGVHHDQAEEQGAGFAL
jgi:hypothetical protein